MYQLANRFVRPAKVLLCLGICYTVADAVMYVVVERTPQGALRTPETQTARSHPPVEDIAALNLFGVARVGGNEAREVDAPTRDTSLDLTLEGVFEANDPQRSTAIVASHDKPAELYRIGATITGGAVLARVSDDHVVLRRDASFESLRFRDEPSPPGQDVADQTSTYVPDPEASPEPTEASGTYNPEVDELPPPLSPPEPDPNESTSAD